MSALELVLVERSLGLSTNARGIPETGEMHDGHTHLANGTLSNSTALKVAGKSAQLSWG
jgi:hypothetical protein